MYTQQNQQVICGVGEEVVILQEKKSTQVDDEAKRKKPFNMGFIDFRNTSTNEIRRERLSKQHKHEPFAIQKEECIASDEQNYPTAIFGRRKVGSRNDGHENHEEERNERHWYPW